MENQTLKTSGTLPWVALAAVVIGYCVLYAPYGLDNNDGGFILGLAHQFSVGDRFYEHILHVRPPVSPILHSVVFLWPLSEAPVLADRLIFFAQITIYSVVSAFIGKREFGWSRGLTGGVALIAFLFSAHSFPPMGWHTVDGIFFSVLAICFVREGVLTDRKSFLCLAALLAVLAAGTKQPYYLTPVLVLGLAWQSAHRFRTTGIVLGALLASVVLLLLPFAASGRLSAFFTAISAQTTLKDLFAAGVKSHLSDFFKSKSVIATWPLLGAMLFAVLRPQHKPRRTLWILVASAWWFVLAITRFYLSAEAWSQPLWLFDAVFVGTFILCGLMFARTRQQAWVVMLALHAVAWASSISWGYLTAALYAAPSMMTIAHFLAPALKADTRFKAAAVALPLGIFASFCFAHRFSYSLEGTERRASSTADMADISPTLRFIKATPEQHQLYEELKQNMARYAGCSFVVLPNMPLAHLLNQSRNSIGIDWPLNAEVGNNMPLVQQRMNHSVDFAIVRKNASPPPDSGGKFGSDLTVHVMKSWDGSALSPHFLKFINPNGRCSEVTTTSLSGVTASKSHRSMSSTRQLGALDT